jgi:hypothetical protein
MWTQKTAMYMKINGGFCLSLQQDRPGKFKSSERGVTRAQPRESRNSNCMYRFCISDPVLGLCAIAEILESLGS